MNKNKIIFLVCFIIILIILIEIITYIKNGIQISELNNMYKDIKLLESNIALYYLDTGNLPNKTEEPIRFEKSVNPNDNEIFYEIDLSKFDSLNLSYGNEKNGENDKYIINEQSHTIYYLKGIEYEDKFIYTREIEYLDIEKEMQNAVNL